LEFRLSALMDSDLAWVNGKSGRQSWRYADAFQRSIISEAICHLFYVSTVTVNLVVSFAFWVNAHYSALSDGCRSCRPRTFFLARATNYDRLLIEASLLLNKPRYACGSIAPFCRR